MKKVLRIVCLTLVFSMLFSLTAFAAEISVSKPEIDVDAMTASVKVTVTDSEDDQQVVILVLANAELGDANIEDGNIAYIDQAAAVSTGTDGEKEYTFNFGISDTFKDITAFNAYFGGTDVSEAKYQKLRFAEGGDGDCNADGMVNISDYNQLITAYGKTSSQAGYDDAADFNADNMVNISDYNTLITNYGKVF